MTSKERIISNAGILKNRLAASSRTFLNSRLRPGPADEKMLLFDSIEKAYSDLEQAQYDFNQLSDSTAVDYASYSILAAEAKYTYLLNLAKKKGMRL